MSVEKTVRGSARSRSYRRAPKPPAVVFPFPRFLEREITPGEPLKNARSSTIMSLMHYKVVETSIVTDEEIERILNEWSRQGWSFSSIHFVTTQASRRPTMAFLFFTEGAWDAPAEGTGA
jgi:hypothetical protein